MPARTYAAEPGWALPDLAIVLPPGMHLERAQQRLSTTHFDTVDRALGRNGIAVSIQGDQCQLHLPDETITAATATTRAVPRTVQSVLLGVRAGQRLIPIGSTGSLRHITTVIDADGAIHASVVDDEITAVAVEVDGVEVVQSRHEITLDASDDSLRSTLRHALRNAGARQQDAADGAREPVVALTDQGIEAHTGRPPTGTIGALITDYLELQRSAVLHGDVALRRGQDAVHSTRVAVRRYRSALRVFADVVDNDRTAALAAELRWFALLLGAVRDPQVRRARLKKAVAELDPRLVLGPVGAHIDEALHTEQLKARERLDRAMRGKRYLALLADLKLWHEQPPLTERADQGEGSSAQYVRAAERTLHKRLRRARHGDDDLLHRARKAAKRARYAAELARPALGKPANRAAGRAKKLQTRLGNYLDSALACASLLRLGAATARIPDENGFTYGVLYRLERDRADAQRARALRRR
jgi:CHAD domain-containing protein